MAFQVPRPLVEFILLGPEDDRRQLQDSPILGDVWIEFAKRPRDSLDLLITPYKDQPAGTVASELAKCTEGVEADIAYLQGIVAARLTFEQVLRFVVPMTAWWNEKRISGAIEEYRASPKLMETDITSILVAADNWLRKKNEAFTMQDVATRKRYIALAGLILWANVQDRKEPASRSTRSSDAIKRILGDKVDNADNIRTIAREIVKALSGVFAELGKPEKRGTIWTVSLNRRATPALTKSVPAVKADAARTLFTVDCSAIVWAVIDSGIDATHHAFGDKEGTVCRIKRSFDFTKIRQIVSLDNLREGRAKTRIGELLRRDLKNPPSPAQAEEHLKELARDATKGRSIAWELVESLVEINPETPPPSNHGTHVAGIIAADRRALQAVAVRQAEQAKKATAKDHARARSGASESARKRKELPPPLDEGAQKDVDGLETDDWASGMCPDIFLYDFRVLGPSVQETEFAIIAALQYIRFLNERNSYMTIHGANLSLSIPHDVRNYACGRTPVCNECERLVNSGVVVVAAAGNRGYQNFETKEGSYESYAAFSVTDPGNADGVITVGATHRFWPHTYGVSFFSSRGPTGDGRLKPDLVAPGERIRAPLPGHLWGDLDGTSMAAPHVSGAAAMLMARYSELVGQPRRIKTILCESATDLGRERSFQGHGMLDVLRAFQSI